MICYEAGVVVVSGSVLVMVSAWVVVRYELVVVTKPDSEEFKNVVKISAELDVTVGMKEAELLNSERVAGTVPVAGGEWHGVEVIIFAVLVSVLGLVSCFGLVVSEDSEIKGVDEELEEELAVLRKQQQGAVPHRLEVGMDSQSKEEGQGPGGVVVDSEDGSGDEGGWVQVGVEEQCSTRSAKQASIASTST